MTFKEITARGATKSVVSAKWSGQSSGNILEMSVSRMVGFCSAKQFSNGTLRLTALLWILQEGESFLLLEKLELSLNNAIIKVRFKLFAILTLSYFHL
jgi:hypothetical protein